MKCSSNRNGVISYEIEMISQPIRARESKGENKDKFKIGLVLVN